LSHKIKSIQTQTQPNMQAAKCISFAEIVQGRDSSVRITDDGMIFAVDLIMVMSGKSREDSSKTLRDLPEEVFHTEKFSVKSMPGKGNGRTKLVTFKDAIELVMVLPGKVAKETRAQFAGIIQRYMAGDESLIAEIQSNAESSAPIAELARGTLEESTEYQLTHKRKLDQLELEERTVELELKRVHVQLKTAEAQEKHMTILTAHSALYTSLCPNQIIARQGPTPSPARTGRASSARLAPTPPQSARPRPQRAHIALWGCIRQGLASTHPQPANSARQGPMRLRLDKEAPAPSALPENSTLSMAASRACSRPRQPSRHIPPAMPLWQRQLAITAVFISPIRAFKFVTVATYEVQLLCTQ
jgi:hypothetical protein